MVPGRGTVCVWVTPASLTVRADRNHGGACAWGPRQIESGGWRCIVPAARSNLLPTARVRPQTLSIKSILNRGGFGCLFAYKEPLE